MSAALSLSPLSSTPVTVDDVRRRVADFIIRNNEHAGIDHKETASLFIWIVSQGHVAIEIFCQDYHTANLTEENLKEAVRIYQDQTANGKVLASKLFRDAAHAQGMVFDEQPPKNENVNSRANAIRAQFLWAFDWMVINMQNIKNYRKPSLTVSAAKREIKRLEVEVSRLKKFEEKVCSLYGLPPGQFVLWNDIQPNNNVPPTQTQRNDIFNEIRRLLDRLQLGTSNRYNISLAPTFRIPLLSSNNNQSQLDENECLRQHIFSLQAENARLLTLVQSGALTDGNQNNTLPSMIGTLSLQSIPPSAPINNSAISNPPIPQTVALQSNSSPTNTNTTNSSSLKLLVPIQPNNSITAGSPQRSSNNIVTPPRTNMLAPSAPTPLRPITPSATNSLPSTPTNTSSSTTDLKPFVLLQPNTVHSSMNNVINSVPSIPHSTAAPAITAP